MSKIIVLMGGGIDSSYIAYDLSNKRYKNVIGLHYDYGQVSMRYEKEAVLKIGQHIGIETIFKSFSFPMILDNYEFKGRNLVMILASASLAMENNCCQVSIGIHKGSPYYDASKLFLNDAQKVLDGYFGGAVQINAPLINLTKPEIWKLVTLEKKFPIDFTYSCQNGKQCGCDECPSCLDRKVLKDAY